MRRAWTELTDQTLADLGLPTDAAAVVRDLPLPPGVRVVAFRPSSWPAYYAVGLEGDGLPVECEGAAPRRVVLGWMVGRDGAKCNFIQAASSDRPPGTES